VWIVVVVVVVVVVLLLWSQYQWYAGPQHQQQRRTVEFTFEIRPHLHLFDTSMFFVLVFLNISDYM